MRATMTLATDYSTHEDSSVDFGQIILKFPQQERA